MNNNENLWIEQAFKYVSEDGEIKYLAIQEVDEGWDYTVFDSEYDEIDGGVYDDPDTAVEDVIATIEDEFSLKEMTKSEIDYDDFLDTVEENR